MTSSRTAPPVPASVRLAAGLLVLNGVLMLLNAVVMQGGLDWADARDLPRSLLRLLAAAIIGWGLLRAERWAWWVGVVLAGFWLITGLLTVVVVQKNDLHWLSPSGFQLLLVASFFCLALAALLLLAPRARATFGIGTRGLPRG